MIDDIDSLVQRTADALIDTFPGALEKALRTGALITTVRIQDQQGQHQLYRIIDFTQQITNDKQEYARMSMQAFNDLNSCYWTF